jgi:hypothetical protein
LRHKRTFALGSEMAKNSRYGIGSVPGRPHFANFLVFASRHLVAGFGAGAHLMNLPLSSRQGAAIAGSAIKARAMASMAAIVKAFRIEMFSKD